MSHFTRVKTQIVDKEFLKLALTDLGYQCEEGRVEVRGYSGNRTAVELKVPSKSQGYDIGFVRNGESYDVVADWWGIRDTKEQQFVRDLTRRYAYQAARGKLEQQGFSLVEETVEEGNKIHLLLRRVQ